MKTIPLTRGLFTTVDDSDYAELSRHKWCANKMGGRMYAVRGAYSKETKKTHIVLMHREMLNAPKGTHVDHINFDTLDNRRENLRVCSVAENIRHRSGPNKNNKTGVRGVCYLTKLNKYMAQIAPNGKMIFLGHFNTVAEASRAYNSAAERYFGEFAGWTNGKV